MREVTCSKEHIERLLKEFKGRMLPIMKEAEINGDGKGAIRGVQNELLAIAGVCLSIVDGMGALLSNTKREVFGETIHLEHKELEYQIRMSDSDAVVRFIRLLATYIRENAFDKVFDAHVRTRVELDSPTAVTIVPIEGFRNVPDSPWYPLPDNPGDQIDPGE